MRNLPGDGVLSSDRVDNFQGFVFFRETLRVNLIYRRTLNVSILPNPKAAPPWPGATVTPPPMYL